MAVTPGYVKCPKCHVMLPPPAQASRPKASGTSLVDDSDDKPFPWVPAALTVMLVGGIGAWLLLRDSAPPPPAVQVPFAIENGGNQFGVPAVEPPPTVGASVTVSPPAAGDSQRVALTELDRRLKVERLWATVSVHGAGLDLQSSECAEAAMTTVLADLGSALRVAGLSTVKCRALHGEIMFDRGI